MIKMLMSAEPHILNWLFPIITTMIFYLLVK